MRVPIHQHLPSERGVVSRRKVWYNITAYCRMKGGEIRDLFGQQRDDGGMSSGG